LFAPKDAQYPLPTPNGGKQTALLLVGQTGITASGSTQALLNLRALQRKGQDIHFNRGLFYNC